MTAPPSTPSHPPLPSDAPAAHPGRARVHTVIFGTDTPAGRAFDLVLILLILASVITVSVETVPTLSPSARAMLRVGEWVLTVAFTLEYVLRLFAVRRPLAYALSFYGIVDLLAILPTYVSLLVPGAQALLVVRVLRLLRIFRVLKLSRYVHEGRYLAAALRQSAHKITVFLVAVVALIIVSGSLLYVVEGPRHGFTSIPTSMYWAVVTLTTVGYGDISPQTPLGQALASVLMIMGYGIIAVPTGIVTAGLAQTARDDPARGGTACDQCGLTGHGGDARYCRRCAAQLAASG